MVSIITPAFNAERYISETIQSVVSQTYSHWEMIIVDDGSIDNTRKIIKTFAAKDNRIKLLNHNTSLGPGTARNTAIKEATGDFIAFLDADDLWEKDKLEIQLQFMKANNVAISYSSYELIDENGKSLNKIIEALPRLTYDKQLKCNYIGNLTGIYNVTVLGKIWLPKITKRQDWIMWLTAIKKAGLAKGIQQSLAKYRIRKGAISSKKMGLLKYNYNVYRKALKFSTPKAMFFLLVFLYEYFFIKQKQTKAI
jgi:glycosyltransferase involved in cell wall biosynthesis